MSEFTNTLKEIESIENDYNRISLSNFFTV